MTLESTQTGKLIRHFILCIYMHLEHDSFYLVKNYRLSNCRDQPIIPHLLCYAAVLLKFTYYMLKNKNCGQSIILCYLCTSLEKKQSTTCKQTF